MTEKSIWPRFYTQNDSKISEVICQFPKKIYIYKNGVICYEWLLKRTETKEEEISKYSHYHRRGNLYYKPGHLEAKNIVQQSQHVVHRRST